MEHPETGWFQHRRRSPGAPGRTLGIRTLSGRPPINRLVLWNIDLTLVDVSIVTREAYAEAFRAVTGRPLVKLTQPNGRPDSEIVFEMLAINGIVASDEHLPRFLDALAAAFGARRRRLAKEGRMMAGARDALKAVARLDGVVQSVLTGTIKSNAAHKLAAFGLDRYVDIEIGGYGEEVYPKATLLQVAQGRAQHRADRRLGQGRPGGQDRRGLDDRRGLGQVPSGRAARGRGRRGPARPLQLLRGRRRRREPHLSGPRRRSFPRGPLTWPDPPTWASHTLRARAVWTRGMTFGWGAERMGAWLRKVRCSGSRPRRS
jgi:phosphoglycolate phosphatase-like HAD superfamily hydrolase